MLKKLLLSAIGISFLTYSMTEPANAAAEDTVYVFNTLLFLIGGFLVMWMAAGLPCSKQVWLDQKVFPCNVLKI